MQELFGHKIERYIGYIKCGSTTFKTAHLFDLPKEMVLSYKGYSHSVKEIINVIFPEYKK